MIADLPLPEALQDSCVAQHDESLHREKPDWGSVPALGHEVELQGLPG